jgi:hypothetical protein
MGTGKRIDNQKANVVAMGFVLGPRVSKSDDQRWTGPCV